MMVAKPRSIFTVFDFQVYLPNEIVFANSSEYLSLTHQATNRSAFMPGLWLAIDKIKNCDQFIYGLEK